MVDSVMVDTSYDGETFDITLADIPERKADLVAGIYEVDVPPVPQLSRSASRTCWARRSSSSSRPDATRSHDGNDDNIGIIVWWASAYGAS